MATHNDRPTLRQLEYLVAVAEEMSFSRAALRCHVSQPTLSSQIRQLEVRVGQDVFERTPRGAVVTPIGTELVALAREALASADRFVEAARMPDQPLTGLFRLGSVSTITPYLIPDALAELATAYPGLDVELHDDSGDRLKERLAQGELDAIVSPIPTGAMGNYEIELSRDPFVLVTGPGSPLSELAEPVSADVLSQASVLLLDDPHCLRGHAMAICEQVNCHPQTALHATSIPAILEMVRRGLGVTLLPRLTLTLESSSLGDLRIMQFERPVPYRTLGLVWRKGSPRTKDMSILGAMLMRIAEEKIEGVDFESS